MADLTAEMLDLRSEIQRDTAEFAEAMFTAVITIAKMDLLPLAPMSLDESMHSDNKASFERHLMVDFASQYDIITV